MDVVRAIFIIYTQDFAASPILLYKIWKYVMRWCLCTEKLMPRRFPAAPELMPYSGIDPESRKSAWHQFLCDHTPVRDMPPYYMTKY